jgi:hypothetical protein
METSLSREEGFFDWTEILDRTWLESQVDWREILKHYFFRRGFQTAEGVVLEFICSDWNEHHEPRTAKWLLDNFENELSDTEVTDAVIKLYNLGLLDVEFDPRNPHPTLSPYVKPSEQDKDW